MKDFDRGLNKRGSSDLPRIAAMMKDRGYLPPQVYSSPSLRTRLTVHGVVLAYVDPPRIDYVDRLYTGGAEAYVNCLVGHAKAEPVMLVGHNPSIAELAHMLTAGGDAEPLRRLATKFPTGSLAIVEFDISEWSTLAPNSGYLVEFVVPSDL